MTSEIRNHLGEKLDYTFHGDATGSGSLLIIGHGVTGNKDRPWAKGLATAAAASGTPALRFSFSGNGDSEGEFRDSTISKEVQDLTAVIDAACGQGYDDIILVGHSMGGAVAVISAGQDKRIKRLISLAGMVYTKQFADVEFSDATPDQGFMWDDEDCPLSQTFVDDLNAIGDVLDRAPQITVPWLLVHGSDDDVVPIQGSRDIMAKAGGPTEFVEITGSNHVFADDAQRLMIDAVLAWLKASA